MLKTLAGILVCLFFSVPSPTQGSAPVNYADSADGFKKQLEDLVAARKGGEESRFEALMDSLAFPSADEWITAHFSAADAVKLRVDYSAALARYQKRLGVVILRAAQATDSEILVKPSELPAPAANSGPESHTTMPVQPVVVENFIYGLRNAEDPLDRPAANSFVYLEGRFRYAGGIYPFWAQDLWRVRMARDVKPAQLLVRVNPKYPKEARGAGVQGVVRLHAIIGKDGSPRMLKVISGDPLLTDAAIEAVQQWRYSPTLLKGEPIEVDTTIDVIFQLHH
jgi:TonB family protein